MVLLTPSQPGRLRHASQVELRVGGAESNLAIALARLGIASGWVSWLGEEEPGELVLSRIRAEGVDTAQVRRTQAPTGLYLREQVAESVQVYYYRRGSAASQMGEGAFDPSYLDGAQFLHLTGITPALSESCQAFIHWAIAEAKRRSVQVSFDVNYRSKLWSPQAARAYIDEIVPQVDLLFLSDEEAQALWGADGEAFVRELADRGPADVVLKRGASGSLAVVDGQLWQQPAFEVKLVDPIGAGDAFAAGYLAGKLWQAEPQRCLQIANALGAYCVMSLGDYEGLPSKQELQAFLEGTKVLGR